jgi:predicted transcriptional regulator
LAKILELRVGPPGDALDRFEAAWNRAAEGRKLSPLRVLSLENLPLFVKTLTPARWTLLEVLRKHGACSIYQLAKMLERNYKNVHTDVAQLEKLGVIQKTGDGQVQVDWDLVRAELRF